MSTTETRTAQDVYEAVRAILEDEIGPDIIDGMVVTDLISGYAEPGYGSDESVIVLGNWNPARFPREGDAPLTDEENIGPRLAERLEAAGAELEWLDEWYSCQECYRAVRSQADSYSWKPYWVMANGCEIICADCARQDPETYLEEYVNNANNAVTWLTSAEMVAAGWEQWEPGNPQQYQNGWHPGQNDNPHDILAEVHRETNGTDVVFLLDASGQFDVHFSAWIRADSGE